MNTRSIIAFASLAVAAGAAFAQDVSQSSLTREQVERQVIAARRAGQLTPAGEAEYGVSPSPSVNVPTRSDVSRAQVDASVIDARADGTLRPAGEAGDEDLVALNHERNARSTVTRAQVKAEVLEARAEHQLVPAGEADEPVGAATHRTVTASRPVRHGASGE